MDLLKNSSKYQSYLNRINDYKQIVDKNHAFTTIQARIEALSLDLKSKKDKAFYEHLHLIILGLSLIVGFICFFKGMYIFGLINIITAIAMKYIYATTLKSIISESENNPEENPQRAAFDLQLFHKMHYLNHGINLKMARISIVRNAFMIAFPVAMISLVAMTPYTSELGLFIPTILAFGMAAIFWFYFFKDDIDELDFQQMELEQYISDFLVNSTKESPRDHFVHSAIIDLEEDSNPNPIDDPNNADLYSGESISQDESNDFHLGSKTTDTVSQMKMEL